MAAASTGATTNGLDTHTELCGNGSQAEARMKVIAFLDGMARTTTDETTPALVARGAFAMNLIAGLAVAGLAAALAPCDSAWIARHDLHARAQTLARL